ncbi:MAG TPA: N-acetylmuramidase family protein [Allosphingosinicella sp.]|jgi:hypothetical protein
MTHRRNLCDFIRPTLKNQKITPELVAALDLVLDRAGVARDDGSAPSAARAGQPLPPFRKELTELIRPHLATGKFSGAQVAGIDDLLDRAGVPRDSEAAAPPAPPAPPSPTGGGTSVPTKRFDAAGFRAFLGVPAGASAETFKQTLMQRLSNTNAPALSEEDYKQAAANLGVPVKHIKAVRTVEVREDPFDDQGRPTILFERHIFAKHCVPAGRFNASNPAISGGPYGKGNYGSKASQYEKLAAACALDPEAAFRACSWGAFQVLGQNAVDLGYGSAVAMGFALTKSEAAHLDCFLRFLKVNKLVDELQACRAGDPASCVPFVKKYNGSGYATFSYHKKLAAALA